MATLEQERAAFALGRVEGVRNERGSLSAKYKTQLLKLPARLHNTGLGQTAAYLRAQKDASPERDIYGWLELWLRDPHPGPYPAGCGLLDGVTGRAEGVDAAQVEPFYRRASAEARALSVWLKRFAEAFLEGDGQ
jgi:CRISPR/Cas system CMR-associated protein Cmr5 small subunit